MKWIITFLIGVVVGAVAVGMYIKNGVVRGVRDPEVPTAIVVPATPPPVTPAAPTSAPTPVEPSTESTPDDRTPPTTTPLTTARTMDQLLIPVAGIKAAQLVDTFNQSRGSERIHEALDILAPKGTAVVAVADGKLVKLFNSKPGGLTVYQFDPSEKYAYYYAHLDRYADGIKEGMMLKRGDLVGYVGSTGNADPSAPHLHFAIFELFPEKQWWKGTPVNPYALLGGGKRP